MTTVLRLGDHITPLDVERWYAPATAEERDFLFGLDGPVLDLGCGPGRLVVALGELGIPALGVDTAPDAIRFATRRGACVLRRSLFEPLPREGQWSTVLLLDGNIGIGGDPTSLLGRAAELAAEQGRIVVEVDPPGRPTIIGRARLERGHTTTVRFPWARVGADDLGKHASAVGLIIDRHQTIDHRFLVTLHRQ